MPKRRQNGEGTLYQRPNGLWVSEVTLGYDESGKRIKKTVSSMDLEQLKKKLNDLRFYNDRKMVVKPSNITLFEWCSEWLFTYKKNTVKPTTFDMYHNVVFTHIKPNLGNYKLDKVDQLTVQRFINDIYEEQDLSRSTLNKIVLTMSQAYTKAIELNMLYTNPAKGIILPKKKKRKAVAFTMEEQRAFLEKCNRGSTYDNLFVFAFNTGMRMGELLALSWNMYDESNGTILVTNNLTRVYKYDNDNARVGSMTVIDTTKRDEERIIPLSKKAQEVIEAQKANTGNGVFVFGSSAGTPLCKRNLYRAFKNRLTAANVQSPVTFHSTRHSFATRLLESGADIKTVSELMGHKSIQITLDIYGHVGYNLKNRTIQLLDNINGLD